MDVSRIGGQNHFVTNSIRADKSGVERLLGVKTTKMPLAREPIEDNFSSRGEATTPAVELSFNERTKAVLQSDVDNAVGADNGNMN